MVPWLQADDPFPDTRRALPAGSEAPGLLAAGAELTPARLTQAYTRGIFPWFNEDQPVLWWSPDPRMVLFTDDFKVSRSLRKTLSAFRRALNCEVRIDSAFRQVMTHCAQVPREGQDGTWISPAMQDAYCEWHAQGVAHSVETWVDGVLVGGLYGIGLGRMFFGESMFSHRTDASKVALAALVGFCRVHQVPMIDCQQRTPHLASLGADTVTREAFEAHLNSRIGLPGIQDWSYHPALWEQVLNPDPGTGTPRPTAPPRP
jgi:leucyl/phenylalanyl-tRNA--protein transferase